jgi:hypothetical protein
MDEIFGGQSAIHDAQIMQEVQNKIHQLRPNAILGNTTQTSKAV